MAQEVERLLLAKILSSNPSTAKKKKKKRKVQESDTQLCCLEYKMDDLLVDSMKYLKFCLKNAYAL
jgi:hypothetical protein